MARSWIMGHGSWVIGLVVTSLALVLCCPASGSAPTGDPRLATHDPRPVLVIIVANRLTLDDINDPAQPNIARLLETGGVGLVSPNCGRPRSENAVLMTAGSGSACPGGSFVQEVYDARERVGAVEVAGTAYAARTGFRALPSSAVFLGLAQAVRAIGEDGQPVRIGAAGDALHRAGMRTSVVGNADLDPDHVNRAASVLAVDSRGVIDIGRLTAPLGRIDACGFATDSDTLADVAIQSLRDADLVVVNFGDSARLDDIKISLSDKAYAAHKSAMMRRLNNLIGRLVEARAEGACTGLVLVSFSPPLNGYWNRLTPIVVYFHNKQPHLLRSNTTRTPGLIAASDFPAVALQGLGLASSELFTSGPIDVIRETDTRVNANHTLILPMLWVFAVIGALSLTAAAVLIAFARPISKRLSLVLRFGLLFVASACLAMLLAVLAPAGAFSYAASAIAVAAAASVLAMVIGGARGMLLVFGATVAAIILDAVTGCNLCKFALPSSYQLEGFRYYGIGNEYAAALVSMSALVALYARSGSDTPLLAGEGPGVRSGGFRVTATVAMGVLTTVVLGMGNLGSNYGATAATIVTFGLILVALKIGRFGARHVIGGLLLGAIVSMAFAYADWRISGMSGTHGGRLIGTGLGGISAVAGKKALMNLRIASSHTAEQAFLAFVPFLAFWFWKIQPKVRRMLAHDDRLIAGLKALVVGSAAAFIMNDSGVVMAGIMVSMTVLALVYALLEREDVQDCGP